MKETFKKYQIIFERYRHVLNESLTRDNFNIDITDLEKLASRSLYPDEEKRIEFYIDNYYNNEELKDEVLNSLALASKVGRDVLEKFKDVPYIDTKQLAKSLLLSDSLLEFDENGLFPIIVYVGSGVNNQHDTIGLAVNKDGSMKMFEGNDEASDETNNLVNTLLYPEDDTSNLIKIYASHNVKLIEQIRQNNIIPKGVYVSPSKDYASGFWGKDKALFSCMINKKDVAQESEYDWKVIGNNAKISKFRLE